MVLPDTPLYHSKTDAEFRIRMIHHIRSTFKDLLGPNDLKLLDLPNGLDQLQARVQQMLFDTSRGEIDLRRPEVRQLAA
ncbi:MAG: hypothetical protein GX442_24365 [Candidatus Riflebacteria bacterium]|nr:hypothetical protein [Candidatus Riflebacteria bacterium]